ncbi:DUF4352 domain-containing protein [Gracilibacillus massiliensis]|uniref:DUF4352 domain-containing protein n=1 Tax=Gracilibacillus massiliensis TaxID=1564956 RepID=UPI00071E5DB7|nr:DUF4352 domain-containing protein [Gracilibacillus massiliensis]
MTRIQLVLIGLLLTMFLIGCNSEAENEQPVEDDNTPSEEVEEDQSEEETDDNNLEENNTEEESATDTEEYESSEDKEAIREEAFEKFPDALTMDEKGERKINDGLSNDHVQFTINSFKLVDEVDGVQPSKDKFLVIDITLENLLGDHSYDLNFIKSTVNDENFSSSRLEKEELTKELTEEENGISTGELVYDVKKSDYYMLSIYEPEWLLFEDEQSNEE